MGSEMKAVKDDSTDLRLSHVQLDQEVELVSIDLPDNQAEPLFERGFLPGCRICPVRSSPSGDPIVDIDGSQMASDVLSDAILSFELLIIQFEMKLGTKFDHTRNGS